MRIKRILTVFGIVLVSLVLLTACQKTNKKAAAEFKKEYESLNGKKNAAGLEHRTVTIDSKNPFVEVTPEELIERIEKGETLFIYVGDKQCPWCRSVIEKAIEGANKRKIKEILYVPIWDDEGNEVFRDKFVINENGVLEKLVDGTESYQKLLEICDELLDPYNVSRNGTTVSTGEKRIYAPTFIYIKNKEAKRMTTGISDKQMDSREELTEEILNDEEKKLTDFFVGTTCDEGAGC